MDFVTAFLSCMLDEDIYIQQPDDYLKKGKECLVCKLKKPLYCLKQLPRSCNKVLKEFLTSVGFVQSSADPCTYIKSGNCHVVVAAYVDDLVIATKTEEEMQRVEQLLQSRFMVTDIVELHYFLGIATTYAVGESIELDQ